jgi:hypothetical protein
MISEFDRESLARLRQLSQKGYVMVIDNSRRESIQFRTNQVRIFAGLDHVWLRDWFPAKNEVRGKFIYLTRDQLLGGVPKRGSALGLNYFMLDRMPPPPPVPSKIKLEGRGGIP